MAGLEVRKCYGFIYLYFLSRFLTVTILEHYDLFYFLSHFLVIIHIRHVMMNSCLPPPVLVVICLTCYNLLLCSFPFPFWSVTIYSCPVIGDYFLVTVRYSTYAFQKAIIIITTTATTTTKAKLQVPKQKSKECTGDFRAKSSVFTWIWINSFTLQPSSPHHYKLWQFGLQWQDGRTAIIGRGEGNVSLLHHVQNKSGDLSVSYLTRVLVSLSGCKDDRRFQLTT